MSLQHLTLRWLGLLICLLCWAALFLFARYLWRACR